MGFASIIFITKILKFRINRQNFCERLVSISLSSHDEDTTYDFHTKTKQKDPSLFPPPSILLPIFRPFLHQISAAAFFLLFFFLSPQHLSPPRSKGGDEMAARRKKREEEGRGRRGSIGDENNSGVLLVAPTVFLLLLLLLLNLFWCYFLFSGNFGSLFPPSSSPPSLSLSVFPIFLPSFLIRPCPPFSLLRPRRKRGKRNTAREMGRNFPLFRFFCLFSP